MDNLTVITCSYNTPDVTCNMLKSYCKYHGRGKFFVVDNSTDDKTASLLTEYKVPFITNKGGLHITSVDKALDNVKTKYALLVDTDIIFLKDNTPVFTTFKDSGAVIAGDVCGDRGGKKIHYRVHPWYCWIDVEQIKNNSIKFYNKEKQYAPSSKINDVGCTFFSDIREKNLKIGDIKGEAVYYRHYEGMSWRTKRYGVRSGDIDHDPSATHNNEGLYIVGRLVESEYAHDTKNLANLPILCDHE